MKKIAIYPGSFNPFHEGHLDVVRKALKVFDAVIIAKGTNVTKVEKTESFHSVDSCSDELQELIDDGKVDMCDFEGLLVDFVDIMSRSKKHTYSIIKGMRNGTDFEYEKCQQYWNEDLGIKIPFFYIISDRNLCHMSSSAIKEIIKFKK